MLYEREELTSWLDRTLSRLAHITSRRRRSVTSIRRPPDGMRISNGPRSRKKPEEPASRQIMPEVLSLEEFDSKLEDGIMVKSTEVPNRVYLVKRGEKIQVWHSRRLVGYLCVAPKATRLNPAGFTPTTEAYLSFYLNLTLNEEEFLKVANLQRTAGIYFAEGRLDDLR